RSPWPNLIPATSISGETSSPLAIRRARTWLDTCQQKHAICAANDNVELPSRLIKIHCVGNRFRLHLGKTLDQMGRYVCLSHCWGDQHANRIITTTIANYDDHLEDIPWDSLSNTFQDAITITWKLGLNFVWIDSLCIIQDSNADWQFEASKMASIYAKSYLTIAASKSRSSQDGCFTSANTLHLAHPIPRSNHSSASEIYARRALPHGEDEWPLLTRGWVLQERLLSPRMLHFGAQELVWECAAGITCECSQSGNSRSSLRSKSHHDGVLAQGDKPVDFRNRWRDVVGEFCKLDLTFSKDRLPALGGLATQMKRYRSGRYLAGLWEDSLIVDMLWFFQGEDQNPLPRDEDCHTPSWSWASVNSKGVTYHMTGAQPIAPDNTWVCKDNIINTFPTIHEANCTPLGPDEMGEIKEGQITLSAPLILAQLRHLP
ncbi:heterokaryon incompatibility protein-domain-containing protein, partial [Amylocarpus encephaloides]